LSKVRIDVWSSTRIIVPVSVPTLPRLGIRKATVTVVLCSTRTRQRWMPELNNCWSIAASTSAGTGPALGSADSDAASAPARQASERICKLANRTPNSVTASTQINSTGIASSSSKAIVPARRRRRHGRTPAPTCRGLPAPSPGLAAQTAPLGSG
jgi:hypothetical protein